MQGPVKKVILLILLWSGFGFALSEYLEQSPSNQTQKDQAKIDQPLKNSPRQQTNNDGRTNPENLEQIQEQAGEQQPLYTNNNSRGRQKNRRLELILKF
jgi:hypothetical protein